MLPLIVCYMTITGNNVAARKTACGKSWLLWPQAILSARVGPALASALAGTSPLQSGPASWGVDGRVAPQSSGEEEARGSHFQTLNTLPHCSEAEGTIWGLRGPEALGGCRLTPETLNSFCPPSCHQGAPRPHASFQNCAPLCPMGGGVREILRLQHLLQKKGPGWTAPGAAGSQAYSRCSINTLWRNARMNRRAREGVWKSEVPKIRAGRG